VWINDGEHRLYNRELEIEKPQNNQFKEKTKHIQLDWMFDFWCFNATSSNISAFSWRPVLVVEEAEENHQPWASNW
jgi:hypothetical protein